MHAKVFFYTKNILITVLKIHLNKHTFKKNMRRQGFGADKQNKSVHRQQNRTDNEG